MTVFRLQNPKDGNLPNGQGWFKSVPYSSNAINAIVDPGGGKGTDPTSIPSPFARIDLVRTAFKIVNNNDLDGSSNFHRIVSHALDIGEMFFNISNFGQNVTIAEWDKFQNVQVLTNGPSNDQKIYGNTLDMYLQQDAASFHFNQLNKIYVLRYKNIPLGGTSPVSLFFSTPDDLGFLNSNPSRPDIVFPRGNLAFSAITALYDRDPDFIEFLFALKASQPNFANLFPEVEEYLRKNLQYFQTNNNGFFNQLNSIKGNTYNTYQSIGSGVFVLNTLPLKTRIPNLGPIASDFEIVSEKYNATIKPLVLKQGHNGLDANGNPLRYYNGPWNEQTFVPVVEPAPLNQRYLPGLVGIQYPFLTIGDFLEPYIIQTVFPIDKQKFFDGNYLPINPQKGISYLLPIKSTFFDFFDKEFLRQSVGGRRVFEIQEMAGNAVKVSLRIPIKRGFIEYDRTYRGAVDELDNPTPVIEQNKGALVKKRFDLAIFPFFKFNPEESRPEYRISLIDGENSSLRLSERFALNFFQETAAGSNEVQISHSRQRVEKQAIVLSGVKHFAIRDNFDFIGIGIEGTDIKGLLIPQFETRQNGGDQFTFAVDLGTTYTHIEYSKNGLPPVPFTISSDDQQLVKLHDPKFKEFNAVFFSEVLEVFDNDFFPEIIGPDQEFYFPVRTSILELKALNEGDLCFAMVERNISFVYEKRKEKDHSAVFSGLKWGLDPRTSGRVESFIESILLMIRNKVLLNNGNLATTKIVWFYPLSMMIGRRLKFVDKWKTLYKKLISSNEENSPVGITESLAPFYYFRNTQGAFAANIPIISIDIGGETTDIVFFVNNNPVLLTSFRFAADAVFRDAYRQDSSENNGFVKDFGQIVEQIFTRNQQTSLLGVYKQIKETHKVSDVIAFFFSLEKNKELRSQNIEISFNQWLADNEEYKIIFAIFYASLIYHIAKILKAKDLPLPRYITFSGTGSKILNILSPDDSLLEQLTRLILERLTGQEFCNNAINIIRDVNLPKEISCKGGIFAQDQPRVNLEEIKTILLGDDQNRLANGNFTYAQANDEAFLQSVESEVRNFIDFFFELIASGEFNFEKLLVQTNRSAEYKEILSRDLFTFITEGLEMKRREYESPDQQIEETLFFYALKGSMHNLLRHISNQ